jgi:ArsR family transcriptional regulator
MMASVSNNIPASPRQAARRRSAVDRRLDIELFKALADPTRAKLLACLAKCSRPCSVSEIAECCAVDFSVVARHLLILARAGAVQARKTGRTVWYSARCAHLSQRLRNLAEAFEDCCPANECGESAGGAACCSENPNNPKPKPKRRSTQCSRP